MDCEYLKAIIWPRKKVSKYGETFYQYTIVGQLLTNEPIIGLEGNEILVDGATYALNDILAEVRKRKPNQVVGDATDVLLTLGDL
jgi:hypothetical protein